MSVDEYVECEIQLEEDEELIAEYHDESDWVDSKKKYYSAVSIRKGVGIRISIPIIGTRVVPGSLFITDLRIIFESENGNVAESHLYKDIKKTTGKDSDSEPGKFDIYLKKNKIQKYYLYDGGKCSDAVNKRVKRIRIQNEYRIVKEKTRKAKEREKALDYDAAIQLWEELGNIEEAARIRKLKVEQGSVRVSQKVVHGDYIDDRDTITKTEVKDSVINRSNVGGGDDKLSKIKELKELHDSGAIDDDEFKQMKKEILG